MTSSSPTFNKVEHLRARFEIAQSVIREAGKLANGYFKEISSLTVKSKGSHDLVSEADLNTELLIKECFVRHFPEDAFFGEETGASALESARGIWVVDPIDGTQPFLFSMPTGVYRLLTCWMVSLNSV